MQLTPDEIVYLTLGPVQLNATVVFSWVTMIVLVTGSWLATRRLVEGAGASRWQRLLEIIVLGIRHQVGEVVQEDVDRYVPFVGTLFLFIACSSLLALVPGYRTPMASISTTAALAFAVFVAVPAFGIARRGVSGYLRHYLRPTPFMLPFNLIGELSRTLALAVRLFGNMMSGTLIGAILLSVAPFFFPVILDLFGLLVGIIQAYVFAVLSLVYVASATRTQEATRPGPQQAEAAAGSPGHAR